MLFVVTELPDVYTLSRVTLARKARMAQKARKARKASRVTLRPPDLRSKGSANLDHYRPRLENVPS